MSGTELISVGDPMPRLTSVSHHGSYQIAVIWAPGPRERDEEMVHLDPLILTQKFHRPLRDNPALFKMVQLVEEDAAIAWGTDDAIDMAAPTIERLAEEMMSSAICQAWLSRHKVTYDAAAAQLGISRRLVAYYTNERPVPRYISLACRYIDGALLLSKPTSFKQQ